MSASVHSLLDNIKQGTAVRGMVPRLDGVKVGERLSCIFIPEAPPHFTLVFSPDELDIHQVDTTQPCVITVDYPEQTVTLTADVVERIEPAKLRLIARKGAVHKQSRNFFRVDANTRVAASSIVPESMAREGEHWKLLGDTIDLSGSGLLCTFTEPLEPDKKVRIELTLPARNMEIITALGHVVRCQKIKDNLYHVALHFDDIDSESQDKVMACCFELQRRYLRMRVRLENQPV
ncbi:MAG: PilZ domain-containing protein [Desulfobulbus sp.]